MAEMIDKIVTGINKGIYTAREGAKDFAERSKINLKISQLKEDNKKASIELGHRVYTLYKEGIVVNDEEIIRICSEIEGRHLEIKRQQELLKKSEC